VNSINWARVMAQMVYYVVAAERLGGRGGPLSFAVPTGNFGNVFAGHGARQSGLPVRRLIVASNQNDILTRFFTSGEMEIREVIPTFSPSMDIQISSNLERLLFETFGRNGEATAEFMIRFREDGQVGLPDELRASLAEVWNGVSVADEGANGVLHEIARVYNDSGMLIDPHTAVALAGARSSVAPSPDPLVVLATAHPAKFPDAVERATGVRPELPAKLDGLMELPEFYDVLPNDLTEVQNFIAGSAR
jgi:threonine synthase